MNKKELQYNNEVKFRPSKQMVKFLTILAAIIFVPYCVGSYVDPFLMGGEIWPNVFMKVFMSWCMGALASMVIIAIGAFIVCVLSDIWDACK